MKLTVDNMNCQNCVKKIEQTLTLNNINANVELDTKTVTIQLEKDREKAIKLINHIGYNAK